MNIHFYPVVDEDQKAIVPLYKFTERREKRGYVKEAQKIEPYLIDIETKFQFSVFEAPAHISYEAIYEYFLDKWQELVRKVLLVHDFKYIAIDVNFFAKNYKPQA